MNLSEIVKLECCEVSLKSSSKEETLRAVAKTCTMYELLKGKENEIFEALQEREKQGSTGFGNGIAIPHCQIEGLESFIISIAISRKGVDFDSIDKKKVKVIVTIIGPPDRKGHLQLLAKISKILRDKETLNLLVNSQTKNALYEEFLRHDEHTILEQTSKKKDKLMLLFIEDEMLMTDLAEIFIEYGVLEATILEAEKMVDLVSNQPLFLGFFNFVGAGENFNKLILTTVSKEQINAILSSVENIVGNLDTYSGLKLMVIDLFFSKGF